MDELRLRPSRGGFLRPFGCGWFIREYLLGRSPYGAPSVDPSIGAPQADIFHHYKHALINETAMDRATRVEEKQARRDRRTIDPDKIDKLYDRFLHNIPYKSSSCRYHSFVVYFSNLQRLKWVEFSGVEQHSELQDRYPQGQPRKYFRLTAQGMSAPESAWADPRAALYG